MANSTHPITGVTLNDIAVKRQRLSYREAVTAHLMKLQGDTFTDVVHKLGTNANRVGEVFRGDVHPSAEAEAVSILQKRGTLLI